MSSFSMRPGARRSQTILAQRDRYAQSNHEAAAIILGDVDHYGGEQSISVKWARLFLLGNPVPGICQSLTDRPDYGNSIVAPYAVHKSAAQASLFEGGAA